MHGECTHLKVLHSLRDVTHTNLINNELGKQVTCVHTYMYSKYCTHTQAYCNMNTCIILYV